MARILSEGPAPAASVHQAAASDAVLVLGEDVWNTAPILGLAVRQASLNAPVARAMKEKRINRWEDGALREAIRFQKGPLFISTVSATELDQTASVLHLGGSGRYRAAGIRRGPRAGPRAPAVPGLAEDARQLAARIARGLLVAEHPLVVSGCSLGNEAVVQAAANVARALQGGGPGCAHQPGVPAGEQPRRYLAGGRGRRRGQPGAGGRARGHAGGGGGGPHPRPGASRILRVAGTGIPGRRHRSHGDGNDARGVRGAAGRYLRGILRNLRLQRRTRPAVLCRDAARESVRDSWRWIGELSSAGAPDLGEPGRCPGRH